MYTPDTLVYGVSASFRKLYVQTKWDEEFFMSFSEKDARDFRSRMIQEDIGLSETDWGHVHSCCISPFDEGDGILASFLRVKELMRRYALWNKTEAAVKVLSVMAPACVPFVEDAAKSLSDDEGWYIIKRLSAMMDTSAN